jgi:hypothetical protein
VAADLVGNDEEPDREQVAISESPDVLLQLDCFGKLVEL